MAEEPATVIQLLIRRKVNLIDILKADADFVLQHAHARSLITQRDYEQVKHCRTPSKKVTDVLDHVIQRGPDAARGLLDLLKEPESQETFPMLDFVKDLHVNTLSSMDKNKQSTKRKKVSKVQERTPAKKICRNSCGLVTEKQLMRVAKGIGRSWREIGRLALNVPNVKLEQIEEDRSLHVERVFAMLHYWRNIQRDKATTAHLHSLLTQGEGFVPSEDIDFLLETD